MLNRFIPVRYKDILSDLAKDFWTSEERKDFLTFANLLENHIEYNYGNLEEEIKDLYHPFYPDSDTIKLREYSEEELKGMEGKFIKKIIHLFDKANYEKLPEDEFKKALKEVPPSGFDIQVDFGLFDKFLLFYRGFGKRRVKVRRLKDLFKEKDIELDTYKRVIVLIKLKDDPYIYIKLFKDIARTELETIIPNTRIKMTIIDKLKLGGTGGAGAVSLLKVAPKIFLVTGKTLLFYPALLVISLFYGARTYLGFRRIKEEYLQRLSRQLYFQNLDNNLGVITRLIDLAEEEEAKEALLAYHFLSIEKRELSLDEIDKKVEDYLKDKYKIEVNFEESDAIEKLKDMNLVGARCAVPLPNAQKYKSVSLKDSLRILDKMWDNIFTAEYSNS